MELDSAWAYINYYCYGFFSVPVKLREVHLKPNSVPSTTDSAEDGSLSTSEELIFYCFPMLDGIVDPHTVIGKKYALEKKSQFTVGQKILKSSSQKNSWNQINQFHKKIFDQIPFFAISKMAKNQFLNWE